MVADQVWQHKGARCVIGCSTTCAEQPKPFPLGDALDSIRYVVHKQAEAISSLLPSMVVAQAVS
jgi:hypothetical protein